VSLLAAVQMSSGADVAANLEAAVRLLRKARAAGAVLAVLPENFALMGERERDKLAVAEDAGRGPIQDALAACARELSLWIVGGTVPLLTPDPARVAAAALLFDPSGGVAARYDKVHLFDVEVPGGERYRESASIAPGPGPAPVVETGAGRLGLSVCYDLRFPELYRGLAADGAEVLAVPSAFTAKTGAAHWEVLLRARAVENQCYVVAAGQWGEHPGGRRTHGDSMVVGPWGEVLARCGEGEGVALAGFSREALQELRRGFPVLEHRRL
jgi:deaminated glutathione amidase